jgi:hypothetical protein
LHQRLFFFRLLYLFHERFLQLEHALRAVHVVQLQAPVDDFQHLLRILAAPELFCGSELVVLQPLVRRLRRETGQAGEHAGTHAVAVRPRAEDVAVLVLLGRGKARGVHGRQAVLFIGQGLARGAEIQQHRRAVEADVDVGRLDVQMQDLVGVHFAQAIEQFGEYAADEAFLDRALARLDFFLQGLAPLVAHDHVHGLVGAEEVDDSHYVGVVDLGQRAAFLEEAFHAVAEGGEIFGGGGLDQVAFLAQHQGAG